jgi:[protein-PII] uridylyltransferase
MTVKDLVLEKKETSSSPIRIPQTTKVPPDFVVHMPKKYWGQMRSEDWTWHYQTLLQFFNQEKSQRLPNMSWRHFPARRYSEVILCANDEPGLLEKIASSFTQENLNIFHAEIYTRTDGVALDFLKVTYHDKYVQDETIFEEVLQKLTRSLFDPKYQNTLENTKSHKKGDQKGVGKVCFFKDVADNYTVIDLHVPDYLGLLKDILSVFNFHSIDVHEAWIRTEDGWADDIFYLSNIKGKTLSKVKIKKIKESLEEKFF